MSVDLLYGYLTTQFDEQKVRDVVTMSLSSKKLGANGDLVGYAYKNIISSAAPKTSAKVREMYANILVNAYLAEQKTEEALDFLRSDPEFWKYSYLLITSGDGQQQNFKELEHKIFLQYLYGTMDPLGDLQNYLNSAYLILGDTQTKEANVDLHAFLNVYFFMSRDFGIVSEFLKNLAERELLKNEFNIPSVRQKFTELAHWAIQEDPINIVRFLKGNQQVCECLIEIIGQENLFQLDTEKDSNSQIGSKHTAQELMNEVVQKGYDALQFQTPEKQAPFGKNPMRSVTCNEEINVIEFSPNGEYLAVAGSNSLVFVARETSWSPVITFGSKNPFLIHTMAWNSESNKLAMNIHGHDMAYFSPETRQLTIEPGNEELKIAAVSWHPAITNLCYIGYTKPGTIQFKQLNDSFIALGPPEELLTIDEGIQTFKAVGTNLLYIISSKYLGSDQLLYKFELTDDGQDCISKEVYKLPKIASLDEIYCSFEVSHDDPHRVYLITANSDVLILDQKSFKTIKNPHGDSDLKSLSSIGCYGDHDMFLIASSDSTDEVGAMVVNRLTGKLVFLLQGHDEIVSAVSVASGKENMIATAGTDGKVNIYW